MVIPGPDRGVPASEEARNDARCDRALATEHHHPPQSTDMPLARIGAAHLSISLATNRSRYSGPRRSGATRSVPIACAHSPSEGVFMAMVASLRRRIIAAGVARGTKQADPVAGFEIGQPPARVRSAHATKPTGEGTGLGLSIAYEIVTQQHGGTIEVDSQIGKFTELRSACRAGQWATRCDDIDALRELE